MILPLAVVPLLAEAVLVVVVVLVVPVVPVELPVAPVVRLVEHLVALVVVVQTVVELAVAVAVDLAVVALVAVGLVATKAVRPVELATFVVPRLGVVQIVVLVGRVLVAELPAVGPKVARLAELLVAVVGLQTVVVELLAVVGPQVLAWSYLDLHQPFRQLR